MLGVAELSLYVDRGYRTRAGTMFYDRVAELRVLEDVVGKPSFVVVWGPRNVGKSELLLYLSSRICRSYVVLYLDVRRMVMDRELASLSMGMDLAKNLLDRIASLLRVKDLVDVVEECHGLVEEVVGKGCVWILDEVHLLENYGTVLEALIKTSLYSYRRKPLSIVVTSSEGSFVLSNAFRKLLEYGALELLVEPMDEKHFVAFAEEYLALRNIDLGIDLHSVYHELTGGVPGAFIALISQGIETWKRYRRIELERIVSRIALKLGIDVLDVYRFLADLPKEIDPSQPSKELLILDQLVENNIVYYTLTEKPIAKPQLPYYTTIAKKIIAEKNRNRT